MTSPISVVSALRLLDDATLATRIGQHDHAAFEVVMRRHNTRLFRVARAILKIDADAEDALQDAYIAAYRQIRTFRGDALLSTWLTRIVVTEALMRLRRGRRERVVVPIRGSQADEASRRLAEVPDENSASASQQLLRTELRQMLERHIDDLPVAFRSVFVMREVEEMSVDETAQCLSIPPSTVRTRLFRARALLRDRLAQEIDIAAGDLFGFDGDRCDRLTAVVLARLATSPSRGGPSDRSR